MQDPKLDRLWELVDKNGPVPAHNPSLGPCWLWTGRRDKDGYGVLSIAARTRRVPRLVLRAVLGRELADGAQACHRCDNPPCMRPSHLFEDTSAANSADRNAKGRQASGLRTRPKAPARGDRNGTHVHPERLARGDRSGRRLHPESYAGLKGDGHWTRRQPERVLRGSANRAAKLTDDQVREIRWRYAAGGTSQPILGRAFGVSHVLIGKVVRREIWTHLD